MTFRLSALRPQNDRENSVILSEAKDPVRQPAALRQFTALYAVTPPDVPLPVDNHSVSACAPGAARRTPTLRYGAYLPAALLGALP